MPHIIIINDIHCLKAIAHFITENHYLFRFGVKFNA